MKKRYSQKKIITTLLLFFYSVLSIQVYAQKNYPFAESTLNFNGKGDVSAGVTGVAFGPDGRLYILEYPGTIKIATIQRNSATEYIVTDLEELPALAGIQDHNDDGTPLLASEDLTQRESIGITVVGTAANPIIYVTSSDFRIGGGKNGGKGDIGLDTNSGIITRITYDGANWDVVDIVRGFTRSEENHALNGLEYTVINGVRYLIVAQGGHTNAGMGSQNFAYTNEYALSAAILSVNLDQIEALPIKTDNGRKYIYDLPTLDDPTRANVNGITDPDVLGYNGIDINDPFGGNDGLNQAIIVPGGPVQILSPGYRNAYDLVVTESGGLYVTDNGANAGWGGLPANEGGASVTNEYLPSEPGSVLVVGGEKIDNKDHLQQITTNLNTYTFGSLYGGHPNPIRANPTGAGLYTDYDIVNGAAVWRTLKYDPSSPGPGFTDNPSIALPANWPPVQTANPVEGDWRGPGYRGTTTSQNPDGIDDNNVMLLKNNANAIDEYTATNFGGAIKGSLLIGSYSKDGSKILRVEIDANGNAIDLNSASSSIMYEDFFTGISGDPLGLTCNSNTDVFPGTIWVGTLGGTSTGSPSGGTIIVYEPLDNLVCLEQGDAGFDISADYDDDGYSNKDEIDNNTALCNPGSQPNNFDKTVESVLISDLNDTDDDNDGILDSNDPFQLGDISKAGSDAFTLPIKNDLFNNQQGLGGFAGLGMTGLMNNGDTGANWLNWLDVTDDSSVPNPNDVLGGAPGIMTSHMTAGTALGTANTQTKGYQYGVQVDNTTGKFTVVGSMNGFVGGYRLYQNTEGITEGELGFQIGDGTQSNYIKFVINLNGFTALQEINDVPQPPINIAIPEANRPVSGDAVLFYFVVTPTTGVVSLEYKIGNGVRTVLGSITAQGEILAALQNSTKDLAVGFIGTSNTPGKELEGSWDYLYVLNDNPIIVNELPDLTAFVNSTKQINLDDYFDDDNGTSNLTYTLVSNSNASITAAVSGKNLDLNFPSAVGASTITIKATDADGNSIEQSFNVQVTSEPIVLYRVNCGGPEIAAIDGKMAWAQDTKANNSTYLTVAGSNSSYSGSINSLDASVNQAATPLAIFNSERYDTSAGAPNITYEFPVTETGNYEVRLYMGNGYDGTKNPGDKIFKALIGEKAFPELAEIDLSAKFGHNKGGVISYTLKVKDGFIKISLLHGSIENPHINGIEILKADNTNTPIYLDPIADKHNTEGDIYDRTAGEKSVGAYGGDGNSVYSAINLPPGITLEPTNGLLFGEIEEGAAANSPYNVTITVDDSDSETDDAKTITFKWTVTEPGNLVWIDKNENEGYTARHENSFVQAGNKFYLMGGRENSKTIDVYDYAADSWTALTNSAPKEFNHFQATEYNGLIWVIGGFQTNVFPSEIPQDNIWMFNPVKNEWIKGIEVPAARRRGSAGLVMYNNKFYVIAGNTDGHDGGAVSWFDEYDPATGKWTSLPDAPNSRDHFAAVVIGNKLYASGGRLSGGAGGVFKPTVPEVDVYDFTTKTWTTLAQNLPTPRAGATTVNFNDKLVVVGGEVETEVINGVNTTGALKITEEYNPNTEQWARLADLNYQRHGTQGIVSGNGLFVTAGSPVKGGGNQKNMEVLGVDNPQGIAIDPSELTAPDNVLVDDNDSKEITITVANGNQGVYVNHIEIIGTDAADFSITAGNLEDVLLGVAQQTSVTVALNGTGANKSAILRVSYNGTETLDINLSNNPNSTFGIVNPESQFNYEGDVVNLPITATGTTGLTYSATGLPPTLTINPTTGVISGTIDNGSVGGSGAFIENNGLVVIEAESGNTNGWDITNLDGATGIIANNNSFNSITGTTIPYSIKINTPGVYRFNMRSFYSGLDSTEENDNWFRFPNTSDVWFFGILSGGDVSSEASIIANLNGPKTDIVFPRGNTSGRVGAATLKGASADGFFKIYRSGGTPETYSWQARTSDGGNGAKIGNVYVYFANAGTFTMEISERSTGHAIDKVALYKVDGPSYLDAQLTALAQSSQTTTNGSVGASANSPYTVEVTATDSSNQSKTQSFVWTVVPSGQLIAIPEVNQYSGEAPLTLDFDGTKSKDDVGVTSYAWDFKDGNTATGATPSHTFTMPGTYAVSLTVGDASGNTSTNSIDIVVKERVNQAPVAVVEADLIAGVAPLEVAFDGSNSTDDISIATYLWDFKDGNTSNLVSPKHTFTAKGDYDVTLTVTDGDGATNTKTITIKVAENQAPVAIIVVDPVSGTGVAPFSVNFNGSNSTDVESLITYAWDFKDGNTSTEANPTHNFTTAGVYNVTLTVTDDQGLENTATVAITVSEEVINLAPVAIAQASVLMGDAPLVVDFTGSGSTDDNAVVSYSWDFDNGSTAVDADTSHTFTTAGNYTVTLTVADEEGLTNSTTIKIAVTENGKVPPNAIVKANQIEGVAPLEVSFTGSESTTEVGNLTYLWQFIDKDATSTDADPKYIFNTPGVYVVLLTVTNEDGLEDSEKITITVTSDSEDEDDIVLVVAPNPVSNKVIISSLGKDDVNVIYAYLFDNVGRLIRTYPIHNVVKKYDKSVPTNNIIIPISGLRNEVYYIKLLLDNGNEVTKRILVVN